MPQSNLFHVWVRIEKECIATEECTEVDAPGAQIKTFATHEAAYEFVANLHETLTESIECN